jgi:hypothetical protein
MSLIMWNWCTKLCVKNRWCTFRSYLGICPNFRWRQVKQWWLFRVLIEESYTWLCLCYLCSYSYSKFGTVVWNYSCFIDYTCGGCGLIILPMWFIMWNGWKYMSSTFYLGRSHVVDMHNAFIIHCIEVSSRSYGPTVPVQWASYVAREGVWCSFISLEVWKQKSYCICSHVHSWGKCETYYGDVDNVDLYFVIHLGIK